MTHSMDIRVYYEDTDAGGIVFYANYLKFCERGRTELLRDMGYENRKLWNKERILFVVRKLEAEYFAPTYLDDLLQMRTSIKEIGNASFVVRQELYREEKLMFGADILMVCVNEEGRPDRLPENIRTGFKDYLEQIDVE